MTAEVPSNYPRCAECGGSEFEDEHEVSGTRTLRFSPPAKPGERYAQKTAYDLESDGSTFRCAGCHEVDPDLVDADGNELSSEWFWD